MIRVLKIMGTMNRGGAETMVMNLHRAIDRTRFQFDYIYFTEEKCAFDDEILELGGKIHRIIGKNSLHRTLLLYKFLKQNKEYQIVHAHTLFSIGLHLLAAKFASVKLRIAHSHNTMDKRGNSTFRKLYHTFSRELILLSSNKLIACGKDAASYLFKRNASKAILINNSVDVKDFYNKAICGLTKVEREFKNDINKFKIIQVGSVNKVKNQKFTLELSKKLKDTGINHKILIVGDGFDVNLIKQEIKKNVLDDFVELTGVRSDVSSLLKFADVLLMPSLHEGFPVILVESQIIGTPALISDTITNDVDFGLDLIYFESLNSDLQKWVDLALKLKNKKHKLLEDRYNKISNKGFDVHKSASILQDIYLCKLWR